MLSTFFDRALLSRRLEISSVTIAPTARAFICGWPSRIFVR
jgi:hypothetical protein